MDHERPEAEAANEGRDAVDASGRPPPERHRAHDAVQRISVETAWRVGEVIGDQDQPVVVDTRRHVSLDALDRLIEGALEDNERWGRNDHSDQDDGRSV